MLIKTEGASELLPGRQRLQVGQQDGGHPTAAGALWKERLREGLLRSEPEQTDGAVAGMRPLSPSLLWAAFHAGPGAAMDFTLFSLLLSFF